MCVVQKEYLIKKKHRQFTLAVFFLATDYFPTNKNNHHFIFYLLLYLK